MLESCRPGATVIPVLVFSDKTQLTLFRNKMAYPIYLTIGSIPKDICCKPSRHAHFLIGYIPVTKLTGISTKAACRRGLANLFHGCMRYVLDLISYYGETGIPMMSSDGVWWRCHPIFANFIGDYPEQSLVTCTYGGWCPKCEVRATSLANTRCFRIVYRLWQSRHTFWPIPILVNFTMRAVKLNSSPSAIHSGKGSHWLTFFC